MITLLLSVFIFIPQSLPTNHVLKPPAHHSVFKFLGPYEDQCIPLRHTDLPECVYPAIEYPHAA